RSWRGPTRIRCFAPGPARSNPGSACATMGHGRATGSRTDRADEARGGTGRAADGARGQAHAAVVRAFGNVGRALLHECRTHAVGMDAHGAVADGLRHRGGSIRPAAAARTVVARGPPDVAESAVHAGRRDPGRAGRVHGGDLRDPLSRLREAVSEIARMAGETPALPGVRLRGA